MYIYKNVDVIYHFIKCYNRKYHSRNNENERKRVRDRGEGKGEKKKDQDEANKR